MLDPPVTAAFGAVREAACGARQSDTDVIQSGVSEALNLSPGRRVCLRAWIPE
jgi:hypothetical protein